MNKNVLTVIIVLLFIVGVFAIISYSDSVPASEPSVAGDTINRIPVSKLPSEGAATVTYSDDGFSPVTVTINAGEYVTWINNSSDRMWVSSDPHPTHTNLPGFDQMEALGPGTNWSHTFTLPGTHTYHNHTNPSMKGTVVVR